MGRPHFSLGKIGKEMTGWGKWLVASQIFPHAGKKFNSQFFPRLKLTREKIDWYTVSYLETCICRSDPQKSEPLYDDDEEEEILGSDDDEQEDPKDYCKGMKHHN